MIDVALISKFNLEDIKLLLVKENTSDYEIYIPKSTQRFFSDSEAIANDYASAAYAGQLLSEASEKFIYDQVSPDDHESILFNVSASNIDELAEALLNVSHLYANEPEDEENFVWFEVEGFIEDIKEGKIVPACPYFIEVFEEFVEEAMEEQEEEEEDEE